MHLAHGDVEVFSMGSGCNGSGPMNGYVPTSWPKRWCPLYLRSCAVWGSKLAKHSVCVQCDNFSVGAAIKKGAARDSIVMHLLRCLWFFVYNPFSFLYIVSLSTVVLNSRDW